MGKIIAVTNEKGGVAKTTTTKNFAVGLARAGKKVLAVDLDPSASLTKSLGVVPDNNVGTICGVFDKGIRGDDYPENYGIIQHKEGIDIIASTSELNEYEIRLISACQREVILRNFLYTLKDKYDYIVLDCAANLGIIVTNALFCADAVIIPVVPQFLSVESMQNLFVTISRIRKFNGTNTKPEIMGVLFTKVRANTNNAKNIMASLRSSYGDNIPVFNTVITMAENLSEADLARESIFTYAPNSSSAMMHQDLVSEFLEIETR